MRLLRGVSGKPGASVGADLDGGSVVRWILTSTLIVSAGTHQQQAFTPEQHAEWVRRYRASGQGLKRFAAENGIQPLRLHYWVYPKRSSSSPASNH